MHPNYPSCCFLSFLALLQSFVECIVVVYFVCLFVWQFLLLFATLALSSLWLLLILCDNLSLLLLALFASLSGFWLLFALSSLFSLCLLSGLTPLSILTFGCHLPYLRYLVCCCCLLSVHFYLASGKYLSHLACLACGCCLACLAY